MGLWVVQNTVVTTNQPSLYLLKTSAEWEVISDRARPSWSTLRFNGRSVDAECMASILQCISYTSVCRLAGILRSLVIDNRRRSSIRPAAESGDCARVLTVNDYRHATNAHMWSTINAELKITNFNTLINQKNAWAEQRSAWTGIQRCRCYPSHKINDKVRHLPCAQISRLRVNHRDYAN